MSFPWLKNLSTAALEKDGRVVPDEELGEDLVAHESTVAREYFFLGGPSSQAFTSFAALFDHKGQIYRPNFREKKVFFRENCVPCPPSK
jgi:hypothetical protein